MRYSNTLFLVAVILSTSGTAWGQLGLYGSPEMLQLPRVGPQTAPPGYAAAPAAAQPEMPAASGVAPVYQQSRPAPAYRYPAAQATPVQQYQASPAAPVYQYQAVGATAVRQAADPGYSHPAVRAVGVTPAAPPEAPAPPAAAGHRPSVVNQMLQPPVAPRVNVPCAPPGQLPACAPSSPQAGCGYGYGESPFQRAISEPCAAAGPAFGPGCCPWYGSVRGLVMTRNQANKVWTSYDPDNPAYQMTNTDDIGLSWKGGFEVRFGRYFYCDQWAVEGVYWTLEPFSGFHSTLPPGANGVSTPLSVSEVEFGGVNGVTYFDNAEEHRLWRRDEIHNIEINLLRNRLFGDSCSCGQFDCRWLLGARFFRFKESLAFGSLEQGCVWGGNGGINEAYLRDEITNSLIGGQMGLDFAWNSSCNRFRVFASPRMGIYNNQIHNYFQLYRGDGTVAQPTAASGMVGIAHYPVNSLTNCVSFLGQVDVGASWRFAPRWSASIGYRVMVATGVGLADNQIPHYIVDTPEIADIDRNGELVLHGAFAGVEYNF